MTFTGVGVWALQRATSLWFAADEGQDAGESRQATAEEGTRTGVVFLALGLGLLLPKL
jgi:hypothetical protein